MKIFLSISLITILLFTGCDQESTLTSSLTNSSKLSLVPTIPEDLINSDQYSYPREDDDKLYPPGADSIFVPVNIPTVMSPQLRVSKVIDGRIGGALIIDFQYYTSPKDTVTINASLIFPPGSFDGLIEILMVLDNKIGTISFYPHMVFNIPALLNLKYDGINLSDININSIDFVYQNDDGLIEQVNYKSIMVLPEQGYLGLIDASLDHFSRYGWTR
jgi:hypothetical protein